MKVLAWLVLVAMLVLAGCGREEAPPAPPPGRPVAPQPKAPPKALIDLLNHPPPSSGTYGYLTWKPGAAGFPGRGGTFVDPVFGSTLRRVTATWPDIGDSSLYAKNGNWNANGTRIVYETRSSGGHDVYDATTGALVRAGIPWGGEPTFSPVDPDAWYYGSGATLRKLSISTGADVAVKTFGGSLGNLGSSVDCVSVNGRYWVLNVGGTARVWDAQADVLFSGGFPASFGGGYIGITPSADGVFLVSGSLTWYPLDLTARTVGAGVGRTPGWNGADHGDVVSASDGNSYFVGVNSNGGWKLMVWNLTKGSAGRELVNIGGSHHDEHFSGIPRGPWRDWMAFDLEANMSGSSELSSWGPFHQEVGMVNVLTGAVRRLSHHRSQPSAGSGNYTRMPRVSANWDGTQIAFLSNFGYLSNNYSDLWTVTVGDGAPPPPPPFGGVPLTPGGVTVQ
jgi:hypothetical protein